MEWSNATAPGANVKLVVSQSTETTSGVDLSALYIVDNNLADVMSESYGACELFMGTGGNAFYQSLWAQAAAQGITVVVSSGDDGSAGCDNQNLEAQAIHGLGVNGIASTPDNVAVGGTDFNDATTLSTYWNLTNTTGSLTSAKSYIPEMTWNDSCAAQAKSGKLSVCPGLATPPASSLVLWSGSGGPSNCSTSSGATCTSGTKKPSWQTGIGVPADSVRDIPDISLFAAGGNSGSKSFYVVCEADAVGYSESCLASGNGYFIGVGGTSASAPSFAGIVALAGQQLGTRLGNANYLLYSAAAKSGASCTSSASANANCVFYDTVVGNNAVPCKPGTANCSTGSGSGVTVNSSNAPAFATTAGYDLATGLGSVNVANLVNAFASAGFTPSSVALQLNGATSAVSVQHGSGLNVSVGVNPTSATGSVAVVGTNSRGITSAKLSSGTAAWSSSLFPGGQYNVHAHYAGDGIHAASDSSAIAVTVSPENSKALVSLVTFDNNGNLTSFNANTATYGSGYVLLRADIGDAGASVSPTAGLTSNCFLQVASCPTGTLSITNPGGPTLPATLGLNSQGFAEVQTLTAGNYNVNVAYSGDASYHASTGNGTFTITKAPTTATAGVSETIVRYGDSTQLVADAFTQSNGVAPSGTFTWFDNGTQLASAGVFQSNPGGAREPASAGSFAEAYFLALGTRSLTAQYSGDSNYGASTSPAWTVNVQQAVPYFETFGGTPSTVNWNSPVTLAATMYGSGAGKTPTGTFTFYDGATALSGTVAYSGTSWTLQGSMPYTFKTAGTHKISARYSGDTYYTSADTSSMVSTVVVNGPFTIVSGSIVSIPSPGKPGTAPLTITPSSAFTGTVTLECTPDPKAKEVTCGFASGSTTVPTLSLNLNGTSVAATLSVTSTAPHNSAAPGVMGALSTRGGIALGCVLLLGCASLRRRRWLMLTVLLVTLGMMLTSCGGGSTSSVTPITPPPSDPGTSPGGYSFTVTGTSGSGASAFTVTQVVTVNVQ